MSEFEQKSQQLTPALYRQFKSSVATGKWPDGRKVTDQQKAILLQSIIIYETHHVAENQRTGVLDDTCESRDGASESDGKNEGGLDESTLHWQ